MSPGSKDFPTPYCHECGYPLLLGVTIAGRRAWFCTHPPCRWCDSAVEAVYKGWTDNIPNYKRLLWRQRVQQTRDEWLKEK